MPETTPTDTFADVLRDINGGRFNRELTEKLHELVKSIDRIAENGSGKPLGKITLTLAIQNDRGIIIVDPEVTVKAPKTNRQRTVMYSTIEGGLSKTPSPEQRDAFETREIDAPRGPVRVVNDR